MGLMGLIPFVVAGVVHAQGTMVTLDAGAANVTQPRSGGAAAGFLGAGLRRSGEQFSWLAALALSAGGEGAMASVASAGVEFTPALLPWWRGELSASLARFAGGGAPGTSRSLATRQSVTVGGLVLWASGALGDMERLQLASDNTMVTVGGSAAAGPVVLSAEGRQWRTADWALLEAAGYGLSRAASAYNLRDATVSVQLRTAPFDWFVSGSWRRGWQATTGSSRAFTAGVQAALTPNMGLSVSGGEQLADPVRGTPEVQIVSAALRWRWELRDEGATLLLFPALGRARLEREADGTTVLTLEVDAPPDARVEYSASFASWLAVPLTRDGARYRARVVLPPGTHRVAMRVNGGAWQPPAGMARVDDELGGAAGLIVVP